MRQNVGAGFPHRGQGYGHQAGHSARQRTFASNQTYAQTHSQIRAQTRADIARFFADLRGALRLTPHQAAAHLRTRTDTIEALERGWVEALPPWHETVRIVSAYAVMAGIDGRAVLAVMADELRLGGQPGPGYAAPVSQSQVQRLPVDHLRRAGTAFANGAKRLPKDALQQARERPDRAFYAVSLPLGLLLLALNTSALSHTAAPVLRMGHSFVQYMHVQFAPVREGHRWIEVDDPRSRRGDKLRISGR